MPWWQALVLGVVQGLTEFLPISSSGHLVIFQQWFGLGEVALGFDIFLHVATLGAILIFFGKDLLKVSLKEWLLVVIATIPAAVVGVLFKDQIEALFASDSLIGWELILTGVINFYLDWRLEQQAKRSAEPQPLTARNSFLIGLAQAVAIIPGISRSGSTVAGAVGLGLEREAAFRFSFLLAIPALAGAGVLQAKDVLEAGSFSIAWQTVLIGCIAAFVSGVASLALFRYVMRKAQLQWFGWYCVVLGLALVVVG